MNLKPLATEKKILEGAVSIWWLPFSSLHSQLVVDDVNAQYSEDSSEWKKQYLHFFLIAEAFIVDIEFHDEDNAHVKGLKLYWESRDKPIPERADLFANAVSQDLQYLIFQDYQNTRETLPGVSPELAEGKPKDKKKDKNGGKQ